MFTGQAELMFRVMYTIHDYNTTGTRGVAETLLDEVKLNGHTYCSVQCSVQCGFRTVNPNTFFS